MCEWIILFFVGALGYGEIEVIYRGSTHWTMLLEGGICLLILRSLDYCLPKRIPLLCRCAAGAGCITAVELTFGIVFNRLLQLSVWDYSNQWGNLWGQICPRYSFYWFLLCLPVFTTFRLLDRRAAQKAA